MRLYELKYKGYSRTAPNIAVKVKKVSLFSHFIKGEKRSLKTFVVRSLFHLSSKGNFSIYYVTAEDGKPIHTSYVTGPAPKFPFMDKGDIHIGPCYTDPDHRGKGIYRKVLRAIHADHCHGHRGAYMIVHEENLPSIKGIEAAGLTHVGTVERQGVRKIYRRLSNG